jgi:poly-beta-hydroxyalkanoate depolymerase
MFEYILTESTQKIDINIIGNEQFHFLFSQLLHHGIINNSKMATEIRDLITNFLNGIRDKTIKI